MGKSLNDNPFNSLGGFNINGIGISEEAIEENKRALGQIEEPKKEDTNEFISNALKERMASLINVSDDEKELVKGLLNDKEDLNALKEEAIKKVSQINKQNKKDSLEDMQRDLERYQQQEEERLTTKQDKVVSDTPIKERTTKKTYIIKDEYIEIIEGLHILKDMEIKEVVNQLLGKAINDLGEDTINKAKKSYRNKDKNDNNNLF